MYSRTALGRRGRGVSYLVIIGGALIAIQGILDFLNIVPAPPPDIVRPYLLIVGVVSVISGVLAMVAGWLILQRKKSLGSPLAILFSIVGFAGARNRLVVSPLIEIPVDVRRAQERSDPRDMAEGDSVNRRPNNRPWA